MIRQKGIKTEVAILIIIYKLLFFKIKGMSFHIKQMAAHATVISSFPAGKSLGLWSSYQCTGQNARGQSGSEAEISRFDREMQKYKAIGQGCFRRCIDLYSAPSFSDNILVRVK